MYLRKTIALVAVAAAVAAPSALALRPIEDVGNPGPTILPHQPAGHPGAKPKAKPTPQSNHPYCVKWGPYCFIGTN